MRRKGSNVFGLNNLGNSCYMNSALQCLLRVEPLVEYFRTGRYRNDLNLANRDGSHGVIAHEFAQLANIEYELHKPDTMKEALGNMNGAFAGSRQQDSREVFNVMMDLLHEDVNRVLKKPPTEASEFTLAVGDHLVAQEAAERIRLRDDSVVGDIFSGIQREDLVCQVCHGSRSKGERFNILSLPMRKEHRTVPLAELMQAYTVEETLAGEEAVYCPHCNQHRPTNKRLRVIQTPPYLLIHLKRFQKASNIRINTMVDFPLRGFQPMGNHGPIYELVAISMHQGEEVDHGHYIALGKVDATWYRFDDSTVTRIPDNDLTSPLTRKEAYILVYRRLSAEEVRRQRQEEADATMALLIADGHSIEELQVFSKINDERADKEERDRQALEECERHAKERLAREESERKAKEHELQAKEYERQAKEQERQAKEYQERQAQAYRERQAREERERQTREYHELRAKENERQAQRYREIRAQEERERQALEYRERQFRKSQAQEYRELRAQEEQRMADETMAKLLSEGHQVEDLEFVGGFPMVKEEGRNKRKYYETEELPYRKRQRIDTSDDEEEECIIS